MNEQGYCFITPDIHIHYVDWGNHEGFALEYCRKHFKDEFKEWKKGNDIASTTAVDFLIYNKGWVLFHSPHYGIPKPTFHLDKINRKQISEILDMYLDFRFEYTETEIRDCVNEFLDKVDY